MEQESSRRAAREQQECIRGEAAEQQKNNKMKGNADVISRNEAREQQQQGRMTARERLQTWQGNEACD
eukprot:8143159-Alexandrium_andersonii.AAC.1